MARINIEDKFWMDIGAVGVKFGDQDRAIGNAVRWFRFAQEAHKDGKLVSEAEFKENGFSEHLIPVFAERLEAGIRARGASKFFGWLTSKKAAGQKGGKSKSPKKLKNLKQFRQDGLITEADRSTTEASSSYSSSSSGSNSDSGSTSVSGKKNKIPSESAKKAQLFIAAYSELFKSKHKTNPVISGRDAGTVKRLVKDLSEEKFKTYLQAYFSMPDAWLLKTKHPIPVFETKLNEIGVWANTSQFMTHKQVQHSDFAATVNSQLQRIREGKLNEQ